MVFSQFSFLEETSSLFLDFCWNPIEKQTLVFNQNQRQPKQQSSAAECSYPCCTQRIRELQSRQWQSWGKWCFLPFLCASCGQLLPGTAEGVAPAGWARTSPPSKFNPRLRSFSQRIQTHSQHFLSAYQLCGLCWKALYSCVFPWLDF